MNGSALDPKYYVRRSKKSLKRHLWECAALVALLFSLCFIGSDPDAEHAASLGPTAQERLEIVSRHPMSRVEYETLRLYGWDKDPDNRQVIVLDKDGEPQLVDYKRK